MLLALRHLLLRTHDNRLAGQAAAGAHAAQQQLLDQQAQAHTELASMRAQLGQLQQAHKRLLQQAQQQYEQRLNDATCAHARELAQLRARLAGGGGTAARQAKVPAPRAVRRSLAAAPTATAAAAHSPVCSRTPAVAVPARSPGKEHRPEMACRRLASAAAPSAKQPAAAGRFTARPAAMTAAAAAARLVTAVAAGAAAAQDAAAVGPDIAALLQSCFSAFAGEVDGTELPVLPDEAEALPTCASEGSPCSLASASDAAAGSLSRKASGQQQVPEEVLQLLERFQSGAARLRLDCWALTGMTRAHKPGGGGQLCTAAMHAACVACAAALTRMHRCCRRRGREQAAVSALVRPARRDAAASEQRACVMAAQGGRLLSWPGTC